MYFSFINILFQNVLFYVLTDDTKWAKETLVNPDEHIYYVGSSETDTLDGLSLSNTDQVGNSKHYLLDYKSRTNFTNLCAPSKNSPTQSVLQIFCSSISSTKFKPNLCAEICQTLFAILPICGPKKILILAVRAKSLKNMYVVEIDPWSLTTFFS